MAGGRAALPLDQVSWCPSIVPWSSGHYGRPWRGLQAESYPPPSLTRWAPHQPREPVLLLMMDVLWSRMPPPRCGLAAWRNASRGGRVPLPGPSGPAPRGRVGGPSSTGPGGSARVLNAAHGPMSPPRLETLVPILQQVGGAVWGRHLRGHHVPAHLVGRSHRHRCGPLSPALRDLQEARCAGQAAEGLRRPLVPLRPPGRPSCPSVPLAGWRTQHGHMGRGVSTSMHPVPRCWGDSNLGIGHRTPGQPRMLHLNLAFQVLEKVCLPREEFSFSVRFTTLMYNF